MDRYYRKGGIWVHTCDKRCKCKCGEELYYHKPTDTHACKDPDCKNSLGIVPELKWAEAGD
jgi:hypothetical protein